MPGAWEQSPTSVLCAILHTENTTVAWSLGLRNLQLPNGNIMPISGMPYDHARNQACMSLIESKHEWLFFLDSDVIPPPDAVLRLLAHQKPIISGVYCRRSPPIAVPVMLKNGQWITQLPESGLIDVDVVGAGCLLIHRSVLESFKPHRPGKHWFDWTIDAKGHVPPDECMSEDFTFCVMARKQGYKILVDPSVRCKHVGYSEVTYAHIDALATLPST